MEPVGQTTPEDGGVEHLRAAPFQHPCRHLTGLCRGWELKEEPGAAIAGLDADPSAPLLDQLLDDGQAEAPPVARSLDFSTR